MRPPELLADREGGSCYRSNTLQGQKCLCGCSIPASPLGFEAIAEEPDLDLSFDLPKLHPQLEDPRRHYIVKNDTNDSSISLPQLKIHRILRQRYQGRLGPGNHYRTIYVQDFPHCLGHPVSQGMSVADMEKWELPMWRAGADVVHVLSLQYIE